MLCYPKYCEVCYDTDVDKLQRCDECKYASFCRGKCETKAAADPDIHQKYCREKKIAFLFNGDMNFEKIFNHVPQPFQFAEFLTKNYKNCNLFTLIEHLSGRTFIKNPENREEMKSFGTVCQYNYTATILFALQKANLLNPDREQLHIDIIGVKSEEFYINEATCALFYMAMPKLTYLRIALFGPDLITESACNRIVFHGRVLKLLYFKTTYELSMLNPESEFMICFNSDIGKLRECLIRDLPWDPNIQWVNGLKKIFSQRRPFAFTSFTKKEFNDDILNVKRVAEVLDLDEELTGVYYGKNYFKELRPLLQYPIGPEKLPVRYANEFLCVMNWKDNLGAEFNRLKSIFENITKVK